MAMPGTAPAAGIYLAGVISTSRAVEIGELHHLSGFQKTAKWKPAGTHLAMRVPAPGGSRSVIKYTMKPLCQGFFKHPASPVRDAGFPAHAFA